MNPHLLLFLSISNVPITIHPIQTNPLSGRHTIDRRLHPPILRSQCSCGPHMNPYDIDEECTIFSPAACCCHFFEPYHHNRPFPITTTDLVLDPSFLAFPTACAPIQYRHKMHNSLLEATFNRYSRIPRSQVGSHFFHSSPRGHVMCSGTISAF